MLQLRPVHGTLVLIRRGPLEERFDQVALGQADPPLAAGFEAAEARLLNLVRSMRPRRIVASDLERSRSTAARLADALHVDLAIRKDLRPQRLGRFQGKPWSELLAKDPDATTFLGAYTTLAPPQGEAMPDLADRVQRALFGEVRRFPREAIVHIGHAGSIRAVCARALHLDLQSVQRWQLDPFGVSILRLEGEQATLALWNLPAGDRNPLDLPV